MNPVLARETRERFRSRRALPFFTAWVLGMGLVTWALYLLADEIASNSFGLGRVIASGYIGRFLFQSTTLLLVTAVIFVVPGVTALAIVGERERQTFPLLQVTQLSPLQLIVGKLSASISYFVLLVLAVLPMAAVPLLFGGATVGDVLAAVGVLMLVALTLASISIWVSSRARSSRGAVAGAYAIALALAFFTLAMMGGEIFLFRPSSGEFFGPGGREIFSVIPNPYFAMVDAVDQPYELRQDVVNATPYTPFEALLFRRQAVRTGLSGFVEGVPPGGLEMVGGRQIVRLRRPPLWIYTSVLYVLISGLALWRAAVAVRAPGGRTVRVKRVRDADS